MEKFSPGLRLVLLCSQPTPALPTLPAVANSLKKMPTCAGEQPNAPPTAQCVTQRPRSDRLKRALIRNFPGETSPYCSPKLCKFFAISAESGRLRA